MNFTTTVLCSLLFCAGTVRAQESGSFQRLLKLEGTLNTRDIGGYRTADGREVVRNKLFRSSELSYLTDEDMHVLQENVYRLLSIFVEIKRRPMLPIDCRSKSGASHLRLLAIS